MFLLQEQTRKSLCRIGFVAFCIVPTCAVAIWAASRHGESYLASHEDRLSRLIGMKVKLGAVEHPEPGVVCYADFVIIDPETGATAAMAPQMLVRTKDEAIVASAPKLTVSAGTAPLLADVLHGSLRSRGGGDETPLRLLVSELILADSAGEATLSDATLRLERTSEGRAAQFTFRTSATDDAVPPAAFTMVRGHDSNTRFRLDTFGAFERADGNVGAIVQFLRTLVAAQVVIPMPGEAEALLRATR